MQVKEHQIKSEGIEPELAYRIRVGADLCIIECFVIGDMADRPEPEVEHYLMIHKKDVRGLAYELEDGTLTLFGNLGPMWKIEEPLYVRYLAEDLRTLLW